MQTHLSKSQRQLIQLFALGYTDGEIACKMALSADQLQCAFANICSRLKVADRIELLLMAWSTTHLRYGRLSNFFRSG
jgi:DNA-binding NarL/FixJ family response regulator